MAIVTVSREVGSGGSVVAQGVAQALGYHLVDRKFIDEVLKAYGMLEFPEVYDGTFTGHAKRTRTNEVLQMLDKTVRAVARHGDVVVLGRAGYVILGGFTDVLHVRIQAPFAARVPRTMQRLGVTQPSQAEALVREGDEARTTFVEGRYGARWDAASAFHLVVDTSVVGVDLAVRFTVDAARAFAARPPGERSTRAIGVDPVLASTVSEKLNCNVDHHPGATADD